MNREPWVGAREGAGGAGETGSGGRGVGSPGHILTSSATLFFVFGANFLFPEQLSPTANLLIGAMLGALVFWRVLKWNAPAAFDE